MYSARIHAADETSARAQLRSATDATHQHMHGLAPFVQIAAGTLPIGEYRMLLKSLYVFHSAAGSAARDAGFEWLSSAGQRLELLRSDLLFFGDEVPELESDWQPGPGEAVLGALYAAEGSMLGGRVIARQLDRAFGTRLNGRRFFAGTQNDRAKWPELMGELEARCAHPRALDSAIAGALHSFNWFEECVTRTSNPGNSFFESSQSKASYGSKSDASP